MTDRDARFDAFVAQLGAALEEALGRKGLSQAKAAAAAGCDRDTVSRALRAGNIELRTLFNLADAADCDVEVVFRQRPADTSSAA